MKPGPEANEERGLSSELLTEAIRDIRERVARTRSQLGELQESLAADEQEERLLAELLAVRGASFPKDEKLDTQAPMVEAVPPDGSGAHEAVEEAVKLLRAAGRPVHISELMRMLGERKVDAG